MFCTKCGKELEEGDRFCIHCGNPVDVSGNTLKTSGNVGEVSGGEGSRGAKKKDLYQGNVILDSAEPFVNIGQNFYWFCIAGMLFAAVLSILRGSPIRNGIALGLFVGLAMWVIGRTFHCWYLDEHYEKIEYYLPYQVDGKNLGEIARKALGNDASVKVKDEGTVEIKYRGIIFWFFLPGDCIRVSWKVNLAKRFFIGMSWQGIYLGRVMASISYLIYQIQQEMFREDGDWEHYKNKPGVYTKIKKSMPNIIFRVLFFGLPVAMLLWTKSDEVKKETMKEDRSGQKAVYAAYGVTYGNEVGKFWYEKNAEKGKLQEEMGILVEECVYGIYVYDETSCLCTAVVGFYSDLEEYNYITLEAMGDGGHQLIAFEGELEQQEDGSYKAYSEFFNTEIHCIFSDGGLDVVVDHSESEYMYTLQGRYEFARAFEAS